MQVERVSENCSHTPTCYSAHRSIQCLYFPPVDDINNWNNCDRMVIETLFVLLFDLYGSG